MFIQIHAGRPTHKHVPRGEMIFALPGNYMSCSDRPFIPNVRTKSKVVTAVYGFYQGNVTGRAECLAHHKFRLTFVPGRRNHTNWLQT